MIEKDKEFVRAVFYFWKEKDDPTRYCDWDEARCRHLMPVFFEAWSQHVIYRRLADLAAETAMILASD